MKLNGVGFNGGFEKRSSGFELSKKPRTKTEYNDSIKESAIFVGFRFCPQVFSLNHTSY